MYFIAANVALNFEPINHECGCIESTVCWSDKALQFMALRRQCIECYEFYGCSLSAKQLHWKRPEFPLLHVNGVQWHKSETGRGKRHSGIIQTRQKTLLNLVNYNHKVDSKQFQYAYQDLRIVVIKASELAARTNSNKSASNEFEPVVLLQLTIYVYLFFFYHFAHFQFFLIHFNRKHSRIALITGLHNFFSFFLAFFHQVHWKAHKICQIWMTRARLCHCAHLRSLFSLAVHVLKFASVD